MPEVLTAEYTKNEGKEKKRKKAAPKSMQKCEYKKDMCLLFSNFLLRN